MTLQTDIMEVMQPIIGGVVIWLDQNKPRPALPYSGIKIISRKRIMRDHYSNPDDNGIQTVQGDREFTLSVQTYGYDAPTDPLENAANKLQLETVRDKFQAKGLVAFDIGAIQDISALLDKTQIEKRANLDIFFRTKINQTDNVGLIETVNVEGRDNGVGSPVYTIVATT